MTDQQQNNTKSSGNIKVAALTGGINTPSTRFRVRQYIQRLSDRGLSVTEHIPFFGESCGLPSPFKAAARIPGLFRSRDADLIWLSRELVQGHETFERFLKHPKVMDVDDAIWLSWPFGQRSIPRIAKKMDAVVAGNSYLADYFSQYCKNVHIVPTAIDLDRYHPKSDENKAGGDKFIIGWTGLACNYKYLQLIEQPLKRFLDDHADAQLMLVANRTWNSETISPERITFVQWTKENEATALHDMTIGVMPLSDDNWTRGKCSFKMLQYMATALPIVISPVGMNADILQKGRVGLAASTADEWYSAIESLYKDHKLRTEIGKTGRSLIEQCYSADIVADQLAEIFKELAAR